MEKQYNNQILEKEVQQQWAEQKTYTTQNNPGPLYSIDTPPPTVSGSLHIGHIFSYTQTDIIARFKRMSGFSVFYPFGFDDNGLATERFVEKKLDISAHSMSRSEFINTCLKATQETEQQFQELWQRMGLSVDWDLCYSTISPETRKIAQESFIDLYKKGFVYRKLEPALYCTACRTAVAQAELDDVEQSSFFNDIVFFDEKGHDLLIGTTRPELLSSCVALLYNPADERYQHLKGTKVRVPLFDTWVPVLEDEQVSIEKGTGLVMCCTFGDKTDIAWFKKFNLPYKPSVGLDGKWLPHTGILAGLKYQQARTTVLEALRAKGLLVNQRAISHAVNTHERCKKEIEYLVLPQWFLSILEHKKTFIELAEQINWSPAFMKARYINWVENISWDWCLSRQRFYGIPFPAWHCQDCGHILLATQDQLPVDPQETAYTGNCPQCNSTNIKPDTDVMDTWNTSSLTPYICYSFYQKKITGSLFDDPQLSSFIPMSMRPQAHDIIRTWAFYTIIKSWMHNKTIPWNDIVISGHVLADSKEKLSKSKDSGRLSPQHLLSQYPADAIRYWTASGGLGQDIAFSENQIKVGIRLITKLWNALRFVKEHVTEVQPTQLPREFDTVNAWILHQATQAHERYIHAFAKHEFSVALDHVETFFWKDLCDNYLELVKDQLFNPGNYPAEQVTTTRWTLHHIGLRILQLYAPYLPHLTESLYALIYKVDGIPQSIHQTRFADVQTAYTFGDQLPIMQALLTIVGQVRRLKTEKQLSLKTPLATLTIFEPDLTIFDQLKKHEQLLRGICQAQTITLKSTVVEGPSLTAEGELWHAQVNTEQI